jgi:hypothetical protein
MFGGAYFGRPYFGAPYFPQGTDTPVVPEGGFERSRSRVGPATERATPQRLGASSEYRAPGRIGPRRH